VPLFVGYFTERPYQDRSSDWYRDPEGVVDLSLSNGNYDPEIGAQLYDRYIDERVALEEHGFDGVMLNSHHSTPFCMGGGPMNIEAAILAKLTTRLKIVLLGNILPLWDDPMWLVEELAMIDILSRGRLVSGWVRGTGRESWAHDAQAPYNWERFQEAHEFIIKAWTTPGPFRWEGEHYQYRYVNPWMRPYQKPHPQVWMPGLFSKASVEWAVSKRIPYIQLATALPATKLTFEYYTEKAREAGWEPGSQNFGYVFHVHVDETEELAWETGRKVIEGPGNLFLAGSRGHANQNVQRLPGLSSRTHTFLSQWAQTEGYTPGPIATAALKKAAAARGETVDSGRDLRNLRQLTPEELVKARDDFYNEQRESMHFITGTPDSVLPKIRHVLETLRPGQVFFWDGDGDQTHEEAMRSMRLMGEHLLPAVREIARDLELESAFDIDPTTGQPFPASTASDAIAAEASA
jgi:alkanesulfonate monooxygenase SsuD/methylene tetrahydromethanopterin reductase-like flavin-dependent oxidoreductase (luciferase family)